MPQWIHDRAQHLMAKNPDMPESQAWAVATQQSHALGKTPKSYGTSEGRRRAKAKYDTPGDDTKTADPEKTAGMIFFAGFSDEMRKIAGWFDFNPSTYDKTHQELTEQAQKRIADKAHHAATGGYLGKLWRGGSRFGQLIAGGEKMPLISDAGERVLARPGNIKGVFSGALQAATPYAPGRGQDEALKVLGARGLLLGGLGLGAYKLWQHHKNKPQMALSPDQAPQQGYPQEIASHWNAEQPIMKSANLSGTGTQMPPNPTSIAEVKSTVPHKPLSGKTPKYSKVNNTPSPSPAAGHQPVSEAPPVRR